MELILRSFAHKKRPLTALAASDLARDAYYRQAVTYFGGGSEKQFPRPAFDAIFEQLVSLMAAMPTLEARLMENAHFDALHFKFGKGRDQPESSLPAEEFTCQKDGFIRHLAEVAEWPQHFARQGSEARYEGKGVSAQIQVVTRQFAAMLGDANQLRKRRDRERRRGQLWHAFRTDPVNRQLAARVILALLNEAEIRAGSGEQSEHPSTHQVFAEFDRKTPQIHSLGVDFEGPIYIVARDLVRIYQHQLMCTAPNSSRKGIVHLPKMDVVFLPCPTRFHGIFKGVPLNECVGGRSEPPEWLDFLTPRRWATIALTDSYLQFMHTGSCYAGFIQFVPLRRKSTGKRYFSLDFGAPALTTSVLVNDRPQLLLDAWYRQLAQTPFQHRLLVSNRNEIDNANVLSHVRESSPYRKSRIGAFDAAEFLPLDGYGERMCTEMGAFYKTMIFDGVADKEKRLTLLNLERDDAGN